MSIKLTNEQEMIKESVREFAPTVLFTGCFYYDL